MIIVQISDIHIDRDDPSGANAARLAACLAEIARLRPVPAAVLATGDLTEHGAAGEYATLRRLLSPLEAPVYAIPGNHDERAVFTAAFAEDGYLDPASAFAHYAFRTPALRVIALDTVVAGQAGGDLCPARLDWLVQALEADPDAPTLIVMHHPPRTTGIRYMDAMGLADEAATRLDNIVRRHPQVVRISCGHVHRPLFTGWGGTILSVCPSVAGLGRLDLAPGADDAPRGEAPAFQVHAWHEGALVTHTVSVAA
ncbi:MAG: phosphodiesterase [Burkholderiales bacterium]